MKNLTPKFILITGFIVFIGCNNSTNPVNWSEKEVNKWFEEREWSNGWQVAPHASVNRKEFAVSYFKNRERWDKAFSFLKNNDLTKLDLKRYDIDGDNLYATVNEYLTRNQEDAMYESHKKYIDIQYVITGKEIIGIVPAATKTEVTEPYDSLKDIEFFNVAEKNDFKATPEFFFIFFPSDAHMPNLKDSINSSVRKIVVKVMID